MVILARMVVGLFSDVLRLVLLFLRSASAIRAENLVLRRQLAKYVERGIKPRRVDGLTRVSLALFSRLFDWRDAVVLVRPATIVRWHRLGWRLFWRWKCRAGRPLIPMELRALIRRMATENPFWGEERIANELLVKLGIRVSPRTVRKYMPRRPAGRPRGDQRWSTFLKNHANAILAYDFFIAVTATFRLLYVFVVIEHASRRLVRVDAICERVIGTVRRECLDWMIPLSQAHLRAILKIWVGHYNRGRPHSSLGPGVPGPPNTAVVIARQSNFRHRLRRVLLYARNPCWEDCTTSIPRCPLLLDRP